mgnify:FL=1
MSSKLSFTKISDYCIQLEAHTIAKVKVRGKWIFEVWCVNQRIKTFNNPNEAKEFVVQRIKNQHDFGRG